MEKIKSDQILEILISQAASSEDLLIEQKEITGNLKISIGEIKGIVNFKNCRFKDVEINKSLVLKSFSFVECEFVNFTINDCTFNGGFSVARSAISNNCWVRRTIFKSRAGICCGKHTALVNTEGDVSLSQGVVNSDIVNIAGVKGRIDITNSGWIRAGSDDSVPAWSNFNSIIIQSYVLGSIYIHRALVNDIKLKSDFLESFLRIDLVKVNKLEFIDFNNYSANGVTISRVSPTGENSEIKFVSSNLGSASIRNCDFEEFQSFYFFDTELSSIRNYNSNWSSNPTISEERTFLAIMPNFAEEKDIGEQKEQYYRAIRNIKHNEGEKLGEVLFRKLELDEKYKSINFTTNKLAKTSLFFSKYSSHHGTNWFLSSTLLITFNIIFFLLLLLSDFSLCKPEVFVSLFNPVHDLGLYENVTRFEGLILLIDYLSRLSTSYLLYQTVRSFRLFG